jgi:hypothetical protein
MDRVGGLFTLTAAPCMLGGYAAYIYTLGDYNYRGTAYAEVDWPNGEIQVFRDYQRRISAARLARRESRRHAGHHARTRRSQPVDLAARHGHPAPPRRRPTSCAATADRPG